MPRGRRIALRSQELAPALIYTILTSNSLRSFCGVVMIHPRRILWDLQKIVKRIVELVPGTLEIHLFGSRAYGTGSRRSDIDLLLRTKQVVNPLDIRDPIHNEFPPVDIFKTHDLLNAESIANGSTISARPPHENLIAQLEAIPLWEDGAFNEDFCSWWQETAPGVEYQMTVAMYPKDVDFSIVREDLARQGIPDTLLGSNWLQVGTMLLDIIGRSSAAGDFFNKRAANFKVESLTLTSEYDFQNLIAAVLRPWIPAFARESLTIRYDGQEKIADFTMQGSKIIIEAKHIRDAGTKAKVLKELDGLCRFYKQEPTCKLILCPILCDFDSNQQLLVDAEGLAADFSRKYGEPVWMTRAIPNLNKPQASSRMPA